MTSTKTHGSWRGLARLFMFAGLLALALPSARGSAQTPPQWSAPLGWCNHAGARLFVGDFNGDGREDMLCHDGTGKKWVALANAAGRFTGTSWEANLGWCNHAGAQLFIGDFNGDSRDDMLCHDGAGKKWVALANAAGRFTGTSWEASLGWCNHAGARLFVGDFNGDGRDDMLCHDGQGRKWVALANYGGQFSGTTWSANMGWCHHAGAQLFVGDFDGNGRDDMLCHDGQGRKWVALSTAQGHFTGTSWSANLSWCNHTGAQLFVGDVNGDRRDDMLCHDTLGRKWVSLATPTGSFLGTSWSGDIGYCYHAGARLLLGAFNQDRREDLLCHDNAGTKWIRYATPAGSF